MNRPGIYADEVMRAYPRFTAPELYERMRSKCEYLVCHSQVHIIYRTKTPGLSMCFGSSRRLASETTSPNNVGRCCS